jgi:hypothetical protein
MARTVIFTIELEDAGLDTFLADHYPAVKELAVGLGYSVSDTDLAELRDGLSTLLEGEGSADAIAISAVALKDATDEVAAITDQLVEVDRETEPAPDPEPEPEPEPVEPEAPEEEPEL